jgi:hypothetical protein
MSDASPERGRIAAVFDLTQPASCDALAKVVGVENLPQFVERGKPFVVLVVEQPAGETVRLAFEGETELLNFYLSTLRINAKLEPALRVRFVLRDLAPAFEQTVRQATRDLAVEVFGPQGSA